MTVGKKGEHVNKKKICSTSSGTGSTSAPADDSAAGHEDVTPSASSPGINGDPSAAPPSANKPVKKSERRRKKGSGSPFRSGFTGSPAGGHHDAAAASSPGDPHPSAPPPPSNPGEKSKRRGTRKGGSGSSGQNDNSAAGHHDAAAAGSSASSASINDNLSASRWPKKAAKKRKPRRKKGKEQGSTSSSRPGSTSAKSTSSGTMDICPSSTVTEVCEIGEETIIRSGLYQTPSPSAELSTQFLKFLNEYTNEGEQYPFYKSQVLSLIQRKCCKLEVNFDHLKSSLLQNMEYLSLVFEIVNNPDRKQFLHFHDSIQSLQPIVSSFLKKEGFNGDGETINSEAEVHFTNKPQSIERLTDFLLLKPVERKIDLLHKTVTIKASTNHGRCTFLAILVELLNRHRSNESYGGGFEIDNIVIVNSKLCWILTTPSPNSEPDQMKCDLRTLWTIMEECYNSKGSLPLYFAELKKSLFNVDTSDVTEEWFRLYLEYHPAFMSSMGRRNLILGLNRVIRDNQLSRDPAFKSILELPPYFPISTDWRNKVKNEGRKIMKSVYFHNSATIQGTVVDRFKNTYEGLLVYIRNFLEHANEILNVADMDEIELFAASQFPMLLTYLLETLLCEDKMQPLFAGVFSCYIASRSDKKDLPIKGRGPYDTNLFQN